MLNFLYLKYFIFKNFFYIERKLCFSIITFIEHTNFLKYAHFLHTEIQPEEWLNKTLNNTIGCRIFATIVSDRKYVARPLVRRKPVSTSAEIKRQHTTRCILQCYYSKCYPIILENASGASLWCINPKNPEILVLEIFLGNCNLYLQRRSEKNIYACRCIYVFLGKFLDHFPDKNLNSISSVKYLLVCIKEVPFLMIKWQLTSCIINKRKNDKDAVKIKTVFCENA